MGCCATRESDTPIDEGPRTDEWSLEQAFWLCSKGQEQVFQGKMDVLEKADTLSDAADRLNTGQSLCEKGYCIVKCSGGKVYYCMYQRGLKKAAYKALGVTDEGDMTVSSADNMKARMVEQKVKETAGKLIEFRTVNAKLEEENAELKQKLEAALEKKVDAAIGWKASAAAPSGSGKSEGDSKDGSSETAAGASSGSAVAAASQSPSLSPLGSLETAANAPASTETAATELDAKPNPPEPSSSEPAVRATGASGAPSSSVAAEAAPSMAETVAENATQQSGVKTGAAPKVADAPKQQSKMQKKMNERRKQVDAQA